MKKLLLVPALAFGLGTALNVHSHDHERFDHFKGEPAATLEDAVANFSAYNAKLAAALEKDELDAETLMAIHQLTYTLEVALEKIEDELDDLADVLEDLHKASETGNADGARKHGRAYLDTARKVIP